MTDKSHEITLRLSAVQEDMLIARMALSSLGMVAGLETALIDDLRTVANECCDCLIHRAMAPKWIGITGFVENGRLTVSFTAEDCGTPNPEEQPDLDIVTGVLETLMPQVELQADEHGVSSIRCSMPL